MLTCRARNGWWRLTVVVGCILWSYRSLGNTRIGDEGTVALGKRSSRTALSQPSSTYPVLSMWHAHLPYTQWMVASDSPCWMYTLSAGLSIVILIWVVAPMPCTSAPVVSNSSAPHSSCGLCLVAHAMTGPLYAHTLPCRAAGGGSTASDYTCTAALGHTEGSRSCNAGPTRRRTKAVSTPRTWTDGSNGLGLSP
jgi:hypothetical protein